MMCKNWLEKDVYNFYVKEGFPMAMVGTQAYMIPENNRGVVQRDDQKNAIIDFPVGSVLHADNYIGRKSGGVKGQDGKGDTHQKIYVGTAAYDEKGNIVRYTGAEGQRDPFPLVLNSRGGEYGRPLELQNLFTADNVALYATPDHRTPGFDIQPERGGSQ